MTAESDDIYVRIIIEIINYNKRNVGNLAITQADLLDELTLKSEGGEITEVEVHGDYVDVIQKLIDKYVLLMGPVALTMAKKATEQIIKEHPDLKLPEILEKALSEQ